MMLSKIFVQNMKLCYKFSYPVVIHEVTYGWGPVEAFRPLNTVSLYCQQFLHVVNYADIACYSVSRKAKGRMMKDKLEAKIGKSDNVCSKINFKNRTNRSLPRDSLKSTGRAQNLKILNQCKICVGVQSEKKSEGSITCEKCNAKLSLNKSSAEGKSLVDIDTFNFSNHVNSSVENAPHFDEIVFHDSFSISKLKKHILLFGKLVEEYRSKIFSDYKVLLDIVYFLVPNCPKRIVKLRLEHSLYSEDNDICFIVRDLKRGVDQDHEITKEKYENILRESGGASIKTIIPYSQLRKEYGNYEKKMRLKVSYDTFLCDGSLIGPVVSFLGKSFKKSIPIPVRTNTDNLGREIASALKKTFYMQGQRGPLISVPIGTNKTRSEHLANNIQKIIEQLKQVYPGGYENIRSMHLRVNIPNTKSIPIYISMCRPPKEVPYVIGPREKLLEGLVRKNLHKFQIKSNGSLIKKNKNKVIGEIKIHCNQVSKKPRD